MERDFTKGGGGKEMKKQVRRVVLLGGNQRASQCEKKNKKSKESEEQRAGRNSRDARVRAVETESPALQATAKSQYYLPWQLLQGSTASIATYTQET
jgi:hypothetical protein